MLCSACGTDNDAGRRFCDTCGAPLTVVCRVCGSSNRPTARFCGDCGTAVDGGTAPGIDVAAAIDRSREIMERLRARPFLERLLPTGSVAPGVAAQAMSDTVEVT